ncbi:MAG: hypothetical protein WA040_06860 [Anaerolineae bacterium]
MTRPRRTTASRSTGDYHHDEARRKNNSPVGMASYEAKTAEQPRSHCNYDPHLSPQLIWAGKPGLVHIEVEDAACLEMDAVSLHIHERVSTQAIVYAVQRPQPLQLDLFADSRQPLREAVEFYRHDVDWANRLLLGDSLLAMNSLLQRELLGVDAYDPLTGEVHSARASQVAAWFLDSDYDRRTFHICQAFFPNKSTWQKLARALKGTLNDDLFDQLTGRVSLPFQPGEHRRIAVKVIDQRGNEVMRVVAV